MNRKTTLSPMENSYHLVSDSAAVLNIIEYKSTANFASKRSCQVIDLETKLKVIKNYKDVKSVMLIACQLCPISP